MADIAELRLRSGTWVLPASVLLLAVSVTPLTLLALAWLLLPFCEDGERGSRRLLLVAAVCSLSLVYASRQVGSSAFDDFWNVYYPSYLDAERYGVWEFLSKPFQDFQASSLELSYSAFLALISLLPGVASPNLVIFLTTALIGGLYAAWLDHYFLSELPKRYQGAAALLCIVLFAFGLCSQTTRQMLSIPILLAAMWERRFGKSTLLATVGIFCHLSTGPIWLLHILLRYGGYRMLIALCVPVLVLLLQGDGLAERLIGLDAGALDKLRYYTDNNQDAAGYDSGFIPIICAVAGLAVLGRRYRDGELTRSLLFFSLLFFALLPLPLASFRATLFVTAGLLAPLVCIWLVPRLSHETFGMSCAALSLAMVLRRVLVFDTNSGMGLWHVFQPIEPLPFRYWLAIFTG